ncbi:hypothetical protein OEZ85_008463 [Tetradesmus obliquus]|uniref:Uncharacterized protein n=1 Tax=Tetradesmus obliquus TaxID=3088 RepID=A0ABY8TJF2_TETOB|nr:hypothetical protein OEZ85_008463 [Tetradesmus obliquus]
MATTRALSVLILLGAVLAASATSQVEDNSKVDFDYFYLVRQWPATFCNDHFCTHRPPKKYAFTVHGLWPQRRDGTWPQFCDSSSELDMDEIEDLLPELEKVWPSWSSDDETFWNHEWTRHGTCAEGVVGQQHAFFKAVLSLHNKLNIQEAFEARGIVPSNYARYHVQALHHALDDAYGVMPHITCDDKGELAEVWMCIDKKLRPIDCVEGPHPHRAAKLAASSGSPAGSAHDSSVTAAAPAPPNFNCNLVKIPKLEPKDFKESTKESKKAAKKAGKKAAKKAAKEAAKKAKCHEEEQEAAAQHDAAAQQGEVQAVSSGKAELLQQQQPTTPAPRNNAQQLRSFGIVANDAALAAAAAAATTPPAAAADGSRQGQVPGWVTLVLLVAAAAAMVAAVALQLAVWFSKARAPGKEAPDGGSSTEERSPLIADTSV